MKARSCLTRGLVLLAAAGFALAAAAAGDKTVLLSLSKGSEPFMALMRDAARDEAAKLGVELLISDGKGDSAIQASAIEDAALRRRVDGVVVAPNNVYALAPLVDFLRRRSIPVVTVDRRVYDTVAPVPHVGIDNVAGGRLLARWVVDAYPGGARIVHLTGQPGSSTAIERARGVREGFAKAGPRYVVVAEASADWSRSEAQMVAESRLNFLKTPPDVIVADNDDMAVGALEALRITGREGKGVRVIGFDALPFAIDRVKDGSLAATVDQRGADQVRTALRLLVDHLRRGAVLESRTIVPALVTPQTLSGNPAREPAR